MQKELVVGSGALFSPLSSSSEAGPGSVRRLVNLAEDGLQSLRKPGAQAALCEPPRGLTLRGKASPEPF